MLLALLLATAISDSPRVLVFDVELAGADADEGAVVGRRLVESLMKQRTLTIISGDDLRSFMQLEASRQELGCTTDSCLSEIAQAMGAEYVLHARLSRVGDARLLGLDLLSSSKGTAVARETVTGDHIRDVLLHLDPAVQRLTGEVAPTSTSTLAYVGGGVAIVGGVAALSLALWAGALEGSLWDGGASASDKDFALDNGGIVVAAAGASALVAVGGATLFAVAE